MESIKGDTIKYLSIELVKKSPATNEEDKIEAGLFKGIRELEYQVEGEVNARITQEFLLVVPPKESTEKVDLSDEKYLHMYSLNVYNVLSFEAYDGAVRHIIFLKCDDADQSDGMAIVRKMIDKMSEAKRTSSDGVIDVNTYTELPPLFKDQVKSYIGGLNHIGGAANGYSGAASASVGNVYTQPTQTTYYTKKPLFLRRRSDNPKTTFIKELSMWVDKLYDKDYIDRPLKVVEKDSESSITKAEDVLKPGSVGSEEIDYREWGGGCC